MATHVTKSDQITNIFPRLGPYIQDKMKNLTPVEWLVGPFRPRAKSRIPTGPTSNQSSPQVVSKWQKNWASYSQGTGVIDVSFFACT